MIQKKDNYQTGLAMDYKKSPVTSAKGLPGSSLCIAQRPIKCFQDAYKQDGIAIIFFQYFFLFYGWNCAAFGVGGKIQPIQLTDSSVSKSAQFSFRKHWNW